MSAAEGSKWDTAKIPPQDGRLAVVTGANGGLGYATALARKASYGEPQRVGGNQCLAGNNLPRCRDQIAVALR
jgi:hypothetical protein